MRGCNCVCIHSVEDVEHLDCFSFLVITSGVTVNTRTRGFTGRRAPLTPVEEAAGRSVPESQGGTCRRVRPGPVSFQFRVFPGDQRALLLLHSLPPGPWSPFWTSAVLTGAGRRILAITRSPSVKVGGRHLSTERVRRPCSPSSESDALVFLYVSLAASFVHYFTQNMESAPAVCKGRRGRGAGEFRPRGSEHATQTPCSRGVSVHGSLRSPQGPSSAL